MKKKILAANWKLNKSPAEARAFFDSFLNLFNQNAQLTKELKDKTNIIFFPSAIALESTSQKLAATNIQFGVQNIFYESHGAYTGENSAKVVRELGGHYALIGHSERRQYFSESNKVLGKKIQKSVQSQLAPMYCIGETLHERESGITESVLDNQISEAFEMVSESLDRLVIAYEPVWAIGTGKIATAQQIQETHAFIHQKLVDRRLENTPILYGGSVKASNAKELIQIPNVNGFLVGGASLESDLFLDLILNCCE